MGRYKTWTLDSGLDHGLDYGLDYGLDQWTPPLRKPGNEAMDVALRAQMLASFPGPTRSCGEPGNEATQTPQA